MAGQEVVLSQLTNIVDRLIRAQERSNEELLDLFSGKKYGIKEEGDVRKRERLRKQELDNARKGIEAASNLLDALGSLRIATQSNAIEQRRASEATLQAMESMMHASTTMTKAQREQLINLHANLRAGGDIGEITKELAEILDKVGKQERQRYNQQALIVKHNEKLSRSVLNIIKALGNWIDKVTSWSSVMGLATAGAVQGFEQLEYAVKNQVPMYDTLGQKLSEIADIAAVYGVSVKTVMETQKQFNQAMIASSGIVGSSKEVTQKMLQQFSALREEAFQMTGNFNDALKLFGSSIETLSYAGVAMSMEEMTAQLRGPNGLMQAMTNLARISNKSVEEIGKMAEALVQDRDIRFSMLAMSKAERVSRLTELLQYQEMLTAKGMEIEQAKEATKALQRLTGTMDPKERYKQLARVRAVSGAMGIEGSEEVTRLLMKPGRKTEEELATIQRFATQLEQGFGSLIGSEDIGAQMFGGALRGVAGGEVLDTLMQQSTAGLEEGRAIPKETLDAIKSQETILRGQQDELLGISGILQRIEAWLHDSGVKLMTAGVAGLGNIGKQLFEFFAYYKAAQALGGFGNLRKAGRFIKGAPAAVARGVAGLGSGVAALGGGIAASGAAGLAGYVAGTGINNAPKIFGGNRRFSDMIVDWWMKEKDAEIAAMLNPSKGGGAKSATDALKEMSESSDESSKKLAEAILANTQMLAETQALMKQGMDVQKAAAKAIENNTKVTEKSTEVQLSDTELARRALSLRGQWTPVSRVPRFNM